MTRPDRELIAQVMLFSQGFRTAESLASKIVPFFNLCDEQLSPQPHYDFGLRALKAVLASAGILKRERLLKASSEVEDEMTGLSDNISEQIILIQSVTETIVPKLVAEDVPLLTRFVFTSPSSAEMITMSLSLQPIGRRFPWSRLFPGRPPCTARADLEGLHREETRYRRAMDLQDLAVVPNPEDSAWVDDGWTLRQR